MRLPSPFRIEDKQAIKLAQCFFCPIGRVVGWISGSPRSLSLRLGSVNVRLAQVVQVVLFIIFIIIIVILIIVVITIVFVFIVLAPIFVLTIIIVIFGVFVFLLSFF